MNKHRQAQKRAIAEKNKQRREGITAHKQLDILDSRLGKGIGATKERARLNALINPRDKNN